MKMNTKPWPPTYAYEYRDALGDLVDALSDEMYLTAIGSPAVKEQLQRACRLLGDNYEGYLYSWLADD
jgi:hypothetical protein